MALAEGILPEEVQKAGKEAIALPCQALEIHIQLHGTKQDDGANDMIIIAHLLDYFHNVDDDKNPRSLRAIDHHH